MHRKEIKNDILFFAGDNLFNTSCEVLSKISTEILKKNVVVRFHGEPGVVRQSACLYSMVCLFLHNIKFDCLTFSFLL